MTIAFFEQANRLHERMWRRAALKARDAASLDREADAELALGHIDAAELLAWRAAALREAVQ